MTNRLAVTWLLFCTGFPAACAGPREPAPAPARPAASTTPAGQATTGPGTRLGLLPVVLVGRPSEEVAAALGLVLERRGMDHLELGSEPFVAPAGADWSATATAFAQWVARPDPAGGAGASRPEAFLYAEVLGDPRRGPTEVRFAVAGADGALLWSDRQGPADADWQRTVRRDPDPLGCMTLVAERLFTLAGWRVRPGPVDGPMAQRFAARSGLPSASERTAMQARRRVLREAYDEAPLVVAASLWQGVADAGGPTRLVGRLVDDGWLQARAAEGELALSVPPSANEQRRLWDLARALQTAVRSRPPTGAEYVLANDCGLDLAGGHGFAHAVVVDARGEVVMAEFWNDQAPEWQAAAPQDQAAVERLLAVQLRQRLR